MRLRTKLLLLSAVWVLWWIFVYLLISFLPSYLAHPLGYCAGSKVAVRDCQGYNSWSGIISDFGEITLVAGLVTISYHVWRHVNCVEPKCPKIGKYKTADGLHRYCGPHHPDHPHLDTREEIHARHRKMTGQIK
jgi:hypothetical protein